jgi:hypothetical protein
VEEAAVVAVNPTLSGLMAVLLPRLNWYENNPVVHVPGHQSNAKLNKGQSESGPEEDMTGLPESHA